MPPFPCLHCTAHSPLPSLTLSKRVPFSSTPVLLSPRPPNTCRATVNVTTHAIPIPSIAQARFRNPRASLPPPRLPQDAFHPRVVKLASARVRVRARPSANFRAFGSESGRFANCLHALHCR
ncbi:hypothetical protein BU26DRAFT_190730 [Trematosphaeria pertusa]|uniref:Uncharacterized protein n=1 Tax=Trematosphaeria pertusa TaxID=390896 RepID=A0A6A6HSM7_9PLEO|nr:uncharacterized protein BU26DRAFT_190730 [Trematosphaeria pertusa]KAF2240802.1 hypothetical protein BU26DRAFT_190730 [Trematosphaeria pertusa]